MNSIQDKYKKIMEVFSDKTLSIGCIIKYIWTYEKVIHYNLEDERLLLDMWQYSADLQDVEIIWHPLHIWDVLDWMDKQDIQRLDGRHPAQRSLLILWKDKRLPLQVEDTDLVDFIYNLLP